MKRALLAILISATGTTVFCALRNATAVTREALAAHTSARQTQTQQLAQLRLEKQQVFERWSDTKQQMAAQPPLPGLTQLAEKVLSGTPLGKLSPAESEQLLAELGFNWHTTGDYLIVCKQSLERISFDGLKGVGLTAIAREVLAITPTEQAAIEATTQQLGDSRTAWTQEHVQRAEPTGDVLAQYSLSVDQEFSRNQLATFTNGILNALGAQRGQFLQGHSLQWMTDFGLSTGREIAEAAVKLIAATGVAGQGPEQDTQPTTLTVERYNSGGEWRMNYTLKQAGNSMTTSVSPWQPFPEAFHSVFPGGWQELASREGFELPKEFKKK